ncbi:MAG: hypothetical protein EOO61_11340 [Hymenobacter sp.]|nr:MAG: hypothetical protein EOO61_11340 [Hymenobacter sp.]
MNLLDFIDYLTQPRKLKDFYHTHGISDETETLIIYLVGSLNIESAVKVLAMEETGGRSRLQLAGVDYVSLLGVDEAIELLTTDLTLQGKKVTHLDRANRLLEYAIYDA